MKKQIVTLTAIAALSVGAATTASADSSYTVKSGDTLWGISQEKNVSVSDLKGWNDLSSDLIFPKQELSVGEAKQEAAAEKSTYTVKSGDTLYRIATNSKISLDQLMSWNGITGHMIYPGDKLVVSGGKAISTPKAPATTPTSAPAQSTAPAQSSAPAPSSQSGKEMTVSATAYTAYCTGCSGITRTGIDLRSNPNQKVIAVDPTVIPLGSKVWVEGYGEAIAGDTGGAIKGNKIDVFIPSRDAALQWGRKNVTIKILE
ncbi:LysM peptidoglycan-binding domain-containing protein [Planococcus sp. X10-3]|uniref:LysM peptidoglycan-binding and 3D domain-containing protein n=1 Tax=Planococcus sp. X10-3 TaxID=3061240 RepID=UPI003BAE1E00